MNKSSKKEYLIEIEGHWF